jgi:hypothetical protein
VRSTPGWISTDSNVLFEQCVHPVACTSVSAAANSAGGLGAGLTLGCDASQGYTGPLCSKCLPGYRRTDAFLCEQCNPSTGSSFLVLLCVSILAVVVVAGLVYYTRKTAPEPGTTHGVMLKLLLNTLQVFAQAAAFDFKWTSSVQTMLDGLSMVSSAGDSVFAVDCIMSDPIHAMYLKAVLHEFLPLASFVVLFGVWKAICKWYGDSDPASFRRKLVSSVTVLFAVIYPSVARSAIRLLLCKPRGIEQVPYMFLDQDVQCWTSEHVVWVIFVAVPMLIWLVGFPVASVYMLRKNEVSRVVRRWGNGMRVCAGVCVRVCGWVCVCMCVFNVSSLQCLQCVAPHPFHTLCTPAQTSWRRRTCTSWSSSPTFSRATAPTPTIGSLWSWRAR